MTASMIQNDTFGEITEAELQSLRARAQRCIICGMLATVDPAFHAARYAHAPAVREGGVVYVFRAGRWDAA